MSAPIDCPICMDSIEFNKNCITTECGHCFHANCLMQSVAHNGFGCPYCRTKMAEEPEEEDEYSDYAEDEEEMFDDSALRGFRMFWNIVNGEEIDEQDDADEQQLEEWEDVEEEEVDETIPTPQFVADKLRSQGYTYEQLVHLLLYRDHEEYDSDDINDERYDAINRLEGEIYGKIRIIVSNYEPQRASPAPQQVSVTPQQAAAVDFDAQPKVSSVRPSASRIENIN